MNASKKFADSLDDQSRKYYQDLLDMCSGFIDALVNYGNEVVDFCLSEAKKDSRRVHLPLIGLMRHQVTYLDCASVLIKGSCIEGCQPLLRSMQDALFGICHIVDRNSEERALSYEFVRRKKKAKRLRRADRNSEAGKELEKDLARDQFVSGILSKMPGDLAARADKIEKKITDDPAYIPIIAEWERLRAKKPGSNEKPRDPEWHALFGGKHHLRDLAKEVKVVGIYELSYKELSVVLHAGNVLDLFGGWHLDKLRPLRHPGGLGEVFYGMFTASIISIHNVGNFYNLQTGQSIRVHIGSKFLPWFEHLVKQIKAAAPPWAPTE